MPRRNVRGDDLDAAWESVEPAEGSPQAAPRFPSLPSMHAAPLPQGSRGGGLLYPQISALPKTFSNSFEQRIVSGEIIITLQTRFLKRTQSRGRKGYMSHPWSQALMRPHPSVIKGHQGDLGQTLHVPTQASGGSASQHI